MSILPLFFLVDCRSERVKTCRLQIIFVGPKSCRLYMIFVCPKSCRLQILNPKMYRFVDVFSQLCLKQQISHIFVVDCIFIPNLFHFVNKFCRCRFGKIIMQNVDPRLKILQIYILMRPPPPIRSKTTNFKPNGDTFLLFLYYKILKNRSEKALSLPQIIPPLQGQVHKLSQPQLNLNSS